MCALFLLLRLLLQCPLVSRPVGCRILLQKSDTLSQQSYVSLTASSRVVSHLHPLDWQECGSDVAVTCPKLAEFELCHSCVMALRTFLIHWGCCLIRARTMCALCVHRAYFWVLFITQIQNA